MASTATVQVRVRRLWPFHLAVLIARVVVFVGGRRAIPYALRFVKRSLLLAIYETSSDGRRWRRQHPPRDGWAD